MAYVVPWFKDLQVDELTKDLSNGVIYNELYRDETYMNLPLFNVEYRDVVFTAYGYKPPNVPDQDLQRHGNLYLTATGPISISGTSIPFTFEEYDSIRHLLLVYREDVDGSDDDDASLMEQFPQITALEEPGPEFERNIARI